MTSAGRAPTWRRLTAVACAYILGGLFSTGLGQVDETIGVYWPAAGVAVGALLVSPRRTWPAVLATLLVLQTGFNLLAGNDVGTMVAWSAANTLGHLLVAWLVVRWQAAELDDVRSVLAFASAALLGSVPAALIGAAGSVRVLTEMNFAGAAAAWLVGDWLGVLTLAPVVLVVCGHVPWPRERAREAALIIASVLVVSGVLFTMADPRYAAQLSYLVLLPLLWAAIRLRTAGVVVAVALATVIAVTATTHGRGPFAVSGVDVGGRSVLLHLFLGGMAASALLLASRTVESEAHASIATERAHLLAAVSHELRTPLTPIVGFSELLLARVRELDGTTREALEAIHRNGTQLTSLIDDLLRFHEAQHRGVTASTVPTDVAHVVSRHLAERAQLDTVQFSRHDAHARAMVDPAHLEMILANLLENAMKHGRPPVCVELDTRDETVELSVIDRGHGVPRWFVPRLFEPFTQEVVGDRRPTLGLGLGLAICRDLAAANGGTIAYEQDADGGARFAVRLRREPVRTG